MNKLEATMNSLDGTLTESKYNTFCNFCSRKVNKGEEVYTYSGTAPDTFKPLDRLWLLHTDCNNPEVQTRMTRAEFVKNAKRKGGKKKR